MRNGFSPLSSRTSPIRSNCRAISMRRDTLCMASAERPAREIRRSETNRAVSFARRILSRTGAAGEVQSQRGGGAPLRASAPVRQSRGLLAVSLGTMQSETSVMRSLKPWTRITDLKQEMDRLFDRVFEPRWDEFPTTGDWAPSLDLPRRRAGLKMEVAGMDAKDIQVS